MAIFATMKGELMKKSDFFFDLPPELIAQKPLEERDHSRLLCLSSDTGEVLHRNFYNLPEILRPKDLLIMNDSRVIPARLLGAKIPSGGAVEFLLLEQKSANIWEILVKPGRKAPPGAVFSFGDGMLIAKILEILVCTTKTIFTRAYSPGQQGISSDSSS